MSPVHKRMVRKGRPSRFRTSSAQDVMRSCSARLSSGVVMETSSTLENWCWRIMPRVSLPAAPASERKQGVRAVTRIGSSTSSSDLLAHEVRERHLGGGDRASVSDHCALSARHSQSPPQTSSAASRILPPVEPAKSRLDRSSWPSSSSLSNSVHRVRNELILGELRQLCRAEHRLVAHQQRRIDLRVAESRRRVQVEHEGGERALQPRQAPFNTTKRAPEIFAAVSKSIRPNASPISKCCFGLNENFFGLPTLRISLLSFSSCRAARRRAAGWE